MLYTLLLCIYRSVYTSRRVCVCIYTPRSVCVCVCVYMHTHILLEKEMAEAIFQWNRCELEASPRATTEPSEGLVPSRPLRRPWCLLPRGSAAPCHQEQFVTPTEHGAKHALKTDGLSSIGLVSCLLRFKVFRAK